MIKMIMDIIIIVLLPIVTKLIPTLVTTNDANIDDAVAGRPSSHLWMQATWPLCMEGVRRASTCATTLLCRAYT